MQEHKYTLIKNTIQEVIAIQNQAFNIAIDNLEKLRLKEKRRGALSDHYLIKRIKYYRLSELLPRNNEEDLKTDIEHAVENIKNETKIKEILEYFKTEQKLKIKAISEQQAAIAKLIFEYEQRGLLTEDETKKASIKEIILNRDIEQAKQRIRHMWHNTSLKDYLHIQNVSKSRIGIASVRVLAVLVTISAIALRIFETVMPGILPAGIFVAAGLLNIISAIGFGLFAIKNLARIAHIQRDLKKNLKKLDTIFSNSNNDLWLQDTSQLQINDKSLRNTIIKNASLDEILENPNAIKALFTKKEFEKIIKPVIIEHARKENKKKTILLSIRAGLKITIAVLAIASIFIPHIILPLGIIALPLTALLITGSLITGAIIKGILKKSVLKSQPHASHPNLDCLLQRCKYEIDAEMNEQNIEQNTTDSVISSDINSDNSMIGSLVPSVSTDSADNIEVGSLISTTEVERIQQSRSRRTLRFSGVPAPANQVDMKYQSVMKT